MENSIAAISGIHGFAYSGESIRGQVQTVGTARTIEIGKNEPLQPTECKTWSNRTYKDRSNDSSVSFQSPTRVSPEMAASAVRAHEQEHVSNNASEAESKGLKAYSTVAIHSAVCPECGRIYVSGGTTTTTYSPRETPGEQGTEQNAGRSFSVYAWRSVKRHRKPREEAPAPHFLYRLSIL